MPISKGDVWPVIEPLTEKEVTRIRSDRLQVKKDTFTRINTLRSELGRSSLILDPDLTRLADAKVEDMIVRGYQGHADPDGNYIDHLARRLSLDISK